MANHRPHPVGGLLSCPEPRHPIVESLRQHAIYAIRELIRGVKLQPDQAAKLGVTPKTLRRWIRSAPELGN